MPVPHIDPTETIPASYGLSLLLSLGEKGHGEDVVLAGTHLDRATLQDQRAQIALWQYAVMMGNAQKLDTEGGLAYELGLRSQVTKHGFIGFGLMSCANMREALAFSERYFHARVSSAFVPHVSMQGDEVVIDVRENVRLGASQRAFVMDMVLIELCSLFAKVRGSVPEVSGWKCEIRVPYPEPPAYARYRHRLPRFHFNQPSVQIRIPVGLLEETIATADPVSVQLAIDRCEQEMSSKTQAGFGTQVLARMVCRDGSYPDIALMAQWLRVSERTLKRRLQDEGASFQALLDQVRRQDSERLLANPALAIKQVAEAVGYADPANFARAFTKWTGVSPREWRRRRPGQGGRGGGVRDTRERTATEGRENAGPGPN